MATTAVGFKCSLCFSHFPIAKCLLLRCCHGFCDQCIRHWFRSGLRNASSCPECRIPAKENQLSTLFVETVVLDEDSESQTQGQLNLAQIVSQQASYVAKQLDKMGPESAASTVARAGKEIQNVTKAVKETNLSDDGVKDLVLAVDDFQRRIAPMFEKMRKLESLQQQLQSLQIENVDCHNHREEALRCCEELKAHNDAINERLCLVSETSYRKDNELLRLQAAYNRKDEELNSMRRLLKANGTQSDPQTSSKTRIQLQNYRTSELPSIDLDSEDDTEINYPTPDPAPTSPSAGAKLRQDMKRDGHPPRVMKPGPKPRFPSEWNFDRPANTKKRKLSSNANPLTQLPFSLDLKGKPLGSVALGSRQRFNSKS